MAGYLGPKAIQYNVDNSNVTNDSNVGGDLTVGGTLLVGKTSLTLNDEGHALAPSFARFTRDSDAPVQFNRTTDDGDVAIFYKDGSPVGSIGAGSNNLVVGTGDTGIRFWDSGAAVLPRTSANGASDGVINLGEVSNSFKNLYLSGGVYLGGTGSANKLDSYEKGTWVPTITSTANQPTFTYTTQDGWYHKIGSLVTISFNIIINTKTVSGTGPALISGCPFTYGTDTGVPAGAMILSDITLNSGCKGIVLRRRTRASGTQFFPQQQLSNAGALNFDISAFVAGVGWSGSITFEI